MNGVAWKQLEELARDISATAHALEAMAGARGQIKPQYLPFLIQAIGAISIKNDEAGDLLLKALIDYQQEGGASVDDLVEIFKSTAVN